MDTKAFQGVKEAIGGWWAIRPPGQTRQMGTFVNGSTHQSKQHEIISWLGAVSKDVLFMLPSGLCLTHPYFIDPVQLVGLVAKAPWPLVGRRIQWWRQQCHCIIHKLLGTWLFPGWPGEDHVTNSCTSTWLRVPNKELMWRNAKKIRH